MGAVSVDWRKAEGNPRHVARLFENPAAYVQTEYMWIHAILRIAPSLA